MTRRLRLVLLALVLAVGSIAGAGGAPAGRDAGAASSAAMGALAATKRVPDVVEPPPHRIAETPARPSLGARAARYARRLLGVPYRYGGDSPRSGFDCSGLVRYVFGHFGLELPHSSYADFDLGRGVPRAGLRPGDLVFFDGLGHVGLYVGSGRFIHAPHSGATVRITSMSDPWYSARYAGARRVVRALLSPRR